MLRLPGRDPKEAKSFFGGKIEDRKSGAVAVVAGARGRVDLCASRGPAVHMTLLVRVDSCSRESGASLLRDTWASWQHQLPIRSSLKRCPVLDSGDTEFVSTPSALGAALPPFPRGRQC